MALQTIMLRFRWTFFPWPWVREVRVERVKTLTDQRLLAYVATRDNCEEVRKAAVERVDDQSVLADVATSDKSARMRGSAVERLTEQSVLAYVARNDLVDDVCRTAVWRLTDQRVLAHVARNDNKPWLRLAAVKRLTEQTVLVDIAEKDRSSEVRAAAVERLKDPFTKDSLAVLAVRWGEEQVSLQANTRNLTRDRTHIAWVIICQMALIFVLGILSYVCWPYGVRPAPKCGDVTMSVHDTCAEHIIGVPGATFGGKSYGEMAFRDQVYGIVFESVFVVLLLGVCWALLCAIAERRRESKKRRNPQ